MSIFPAKAFVFMASVVFCNLPVAACAQEVNVMSFNLGHISFGDLVEIRNDIYRYNFETVREQILEFGLAQDPNEGRKNNFLHPDCRITIDRCEKQPSTIDQVQLTPSSYPYITGYNETFKADVESLIYELKLNENYSIEKIDSLNGCFLFWSFKLSIYVEIKMNQTEAVVAIY